MSGCDLLRFDEKPGDLAISRYPILEGILPLVEKSRGPRPKKTPWFAQHTYRREDLLIRTFVSSRHGARRHVEVIPEESSRRTWF